MIIFLTLISNNFFENGAEKSYYKSVKKSLDQEGRHSSDQTLGVFDILKSLDILPLIM
jgi:hypothetical protein